MSRRVWLMMSLTGLGLLFWVSLSACALTPASYCERTIVGMCGKVHECGTASQKSSITWLWGKDVEDCILRHKQGKVGLAAFGPANCEVVTQESSCENSSKPVYHSEKASACLDGRLKQACPSSILDYFKLPAVCGEICQAT